MFGDGHVINVGDRLLAKTGIVHNNGMIGRSEICTVSQSDEQWLKVATPSGDTVSFNREKMKDTVKFDDVFGIVNYTIEELENAHLVLTSIGLIVTDNSGNEMQANELTRHYHGYLMFGE